MATAHLSTQLNIFIPANYKYFTANFSRSVLLPPLCLSFMCKFSDTSEPYTL